MTLTATATFNPTNVLAQLTPREALVLHALVDTYDKRSNDDDVKNRRVLYVGVRSTTLIHTLKNQMPKSAVRKALTRLHDLQLIYLTGDSFLGFAWKPMLAAKQAFGIA